MVVRRKKSTGAAKKPSKRVVKLARKYKVKITIKRGSKRVYKTTKLILQQIRRKKKSTTKKTRKNKFGDSFWKYWNLNPKNNAARQQSQYPVPYYQQIPTAYPPIAQQYTYPPIAQQERAGRPERRPPITNSRSSVPASGRPPIGPDNIKLQFQSDQNNDGRECVTSLRKSARRHPFGMYVEKQNNREILKKIDKIVNEICDIDGTGFIRKVEILYVELYALARREKITNY
jgi:hypothetical protein